MPQLSPINWLLILFTMWPMMLMMMNFIYFNKYSQPYTIKKSFFLNHLKNWKW
uniref:ATP synthase F0 subunit 8 n=1 Tax=Leptaulax koreanus TaxID=2607329 RepID=A0A5C0XLY0_9SCAR|nr:ATP synthase F0 subunit 8 [Leptaulax koreanus]QEK77355.1 ATP synthase F0 subunit 8 [Leptaulax koreanus]